MHLIGYMSESYIPTAEADGIITDIVAEAQLRNITEGITGILFYHDGKFIQLIEGYENALRGLVERIARDPRHGDLHFFLDETVLHRSCAEWSMVSINLEQKRDLDHQLLEHIHGIYQKKLRIEASGFTSTLRDFLAIPDISVELFG